MKTYNYLLMSILALWILPNLAMAQIDGSDGFTQTNGGYGGQVIRVTSLAPDGPGSFHEAVTTSGPRIVVFEVAGVIDLDKQTVVIEEPHLTIAGQTAPSPGITFIRGGISIRTHDVIVKHIRVRPGEAGEAKNSGWEIDGLNAFRSNAHDIIVDHCSFSWATDENLSVSGPRTLGPDSTARKITFSNNIIAECLSNSTHPNGEHSKGTLVHDYCREIAILGNIYSQNFDRNPYFKAFTTGSIVNNMIYNPGKNAIQLGFTAAEWNGSGITPENAQVNIVGNVYQQGPDTQSNLPLVNGHGDAYLEDNIAMDQAGNPVPKTSNNITLLNQKVFWPSNIQPLSSTEVVNYTTTYAGARPADRDANDIRIVTDVLNKTGKVIDSEQEVDGYPVFAPVSHTLNIPTGAAAIQTWLDQLDQEVTVSPIDVAITSPVTGSVFTVNDVVTIEASASHSNGTIVKVEFYEGATKLGEDTSAPYSFNWNNPLLGNYSLSAVAIDDQGASFSSFPVSMFVISDVSRVTNLDFEAESFSGQSLFAPYTVINDNTASGNAYIVSDVGNSQQSQTEPGQIVIEFELSESASVTFSALVDFPSNTDDSFFYQVDDGDWFTQNNTQTLGWETLTINTFEDLSPGQHTLRVLRRENGTKIDKINLSTTNPVLSVPNSNPSPDTEAPTSPSGLAESNVSGSSFDITWTASTDNVGVTGYEVFLDGSSQGTTTNTNYSFTSLQPSTTYTVTLTAVDAAGNTSALSNGYDVTTTELNCSNFTVSASSSSGGANYTPDKATDGDLTTSWATEYFAPTEEWIQFEFDCEVSVNGVKIAFAMGADRTNDFKIATSTDGSTFTDQTSVLTSSGTSLALETFALPSAVNAKYVRIIGYGNSDNDWNNYTEVEIDYSDASVVPDIEAPTVPTGLTESNVTTDAFDISWTASTDNVGVTGYEVFLDGSSQGTTTNTNYSFTSLQASTTYTVTVIAMDAAGNPSAPSNGYDVTTTAISCDNTTATASSSSGGADYTPDKATDGDLSTSWATQYFAPTEEWIQFEFDCEKTVEAVLIAFFKGDDRTADFKIVTSTDGSTFTDQTAVLTSSGTSLALETFTLPSPVSAKYVRVIGYGNSSNDWNNYTEIEFTFSASNARYSAGSQTVLEEEEAIASQQVALFPNPVSDILHVKLPNNKPSVIAIFTIQGQLLLHNKIETEAAVDLSGLTKGLYLIKIWNMDSMFKHKILK